MFTVSYYEYKGEIYLLTTGNGGNVDVLRLADFKNGSFASRSLFGLSFSGYFDSKSLSKMSSSKGSKKTGFSCRFSGTRLSSVGKGISTDFPYTHTFAGLP